MSDTPATQQLDDGSSYRSVLRCVGNAFILYGLSDLGMLAWCAWQGENCSSSFNLFAVVAGLLIRRGNLRVARWRRS